MRVIEKAGPLEAYNVFKLMKWHAEDCGLQRPTMDDYEKLLFQLLDPKFSFSLIMHGRRPCGMFWGYSEGTTFVILGRYLLRNFRTFKFKRTLVDVGLQTTKTFGTLRYILPPKAKVSPRLKPVGLIAEEVRKE